MAATDAGPRKTVGSPFMSESFLSPSVYFFQRANTVDTHSYMHDVVTLLTEDRSLMGGT